jgi:7-cyano-7-deazaguanine synthase in queuosine biosynthesis
MIEPRLFLCNEAVLAENDPLRDGRHTVELRTFGTRQNVNINLEDLARVFHEHLTPRLKDLLEIASYIYTADCGTNRGEKGKWGDNDSTEPWPRDFQFVVPVRDLKFWADSEVAALLSEITLFLADDKCQFMFLPFSGPDEKQLYFEYGGWDDWPFYDVDRVIMFSGGLDSLAGAVETAANGGKLVLVSHRPVTTQGKRQKDLCQALTQMFPVPTIHIPVCINKDENISREHTQRTRSFLYATLGAIVAASVRAAGVRFFENGIVSLNLPVADEVLRSRASRTTHPKSLQLFEQFFSRVLGRQTAFDNPYVLKTKAEVVSLIGAKNAGPLIGQSCSCSHQGLFHSKTQWHCGTCSQCIDRRMAIFASGVEQYDKADDYVSDVFTGPRDEGYERQIAVNYARHAMELNRMSAVEMAAKFNAELSRASRCFPRRSEAAEEFVEMHRRHGKAAMEVLESQIQQHATEITCGTLEPSSMLALVVGRQHCEPGWTRYAGKLTDLLRRGVPTACKTHKPKDEPHLQQICDGILQSFDEDIEREFPFMRWASGATKADWSKDSLRLWVELKYVRKRTDVRTIEKAIAEDITKYGDNQVRVLYIVYDPGHLVDDEAAFSTPIRKRPGMLVDFIR